MNKKLILATTGLVCAPVLLPAKSAKAQKEDASRPNILLILCDDMGYGDLACYGQPFISTPNIDRVAEEGIRFTQAYAGSPVSAPSRATIMTGQHSGHSHVRGNKEYWSYDNTMKYGDNVDFAVVGQEPYDPAHKILPDSRIVATVPASLASGLVAMRAPHQHPTSVALTNSTVISASSKHTCIIQTSSTVSRVLLVTLP